MLKLEGTRRRRRIKSSKNELIDGVQGYTLYYAPNVTITYHLRSQS